MKDFFIYFFGQGEEIEFTNFSLFHFLPIVLMIGIILITYFFRDKIRVFKYEKQICYTMAFIMIVSEMSYYWRLIAVPGLNPNVMDHLPISVCGWGIVFSSYLVLTKSQTLYDITYFWLFGGTIFALITPTVITYTGPTRFRYYQFWLEHTMGYISIFYMTFVHKMRPTIKSAIKSYSAFAILAVIAYVANVMIGPGANYLFMARPESTPSILDILPKNFAVRILIMASAVTFLYFLSYLPWLIKDIKAKKASSK